MIDSEYRKTILPNGVRVVTEAMPNVRSVTTGIWVDVGSRDEAAEESGISHLLEHMFFKGTQRRSALDIAKELDAIGGMSNAFTCKEQTCFHAKVLDVHLDQVVDLLLDIFRNSLFSVDDVEREKQVVLQEISMVEDTPEEYAHVVFSRDFWGDNPLGRSVLGTAETVSGFDHGRIVGYIGKSYVPSRVIVTAAGNLEHERFVDLVRASLADLIPGDGLVQRQPPVFGRVIRCYSESIEQVHLCLGAPGPSAVDDVRFADILLTTILGGNMSSRLFQEIREKRGLAYNVYSYVNTYEDTGMHGFYLAVRPDQVLPSMELLAAELKNLRDGNLEAQELDAAKEYLKGSLLLNAESSENRMMRLARNELSFRRFVPFDEVLGKIDAVTVPTIIELARTRFEPQRMSAVTYGPWEGDLDVFG